MRCDEIRRFSDLYIDGEFEEREKALFEAHLQSCEACRAQVGAWLAFRNAIRKKMAEQPAMPDDVRTRLMAGIGKAKSSTQHNAWKRVAFAVASMAMVVALGYMVSQSRPEPALEVESLIAESVANHEASLPPEVEGTMASMMPVLSKWMDNPPLPPLREDQLTRLEGARLTRVGNKQAILYRYNHRGHIMTVLQVPHAFRNLAAAEGKPIQPPKLVYDGAREGLNISLYEGHGHTTTVVSDTPRPQIQLVP